MLKTFLRPAMIFLPFLGGAVFQVHTRFCWKLSGGADLSLWLIRIALLTMAYFICLQVTPRSLRPHKNHFCIVGLNLLMGLAPYFLLHWAGLEILALAAFFVGITPTANAAPVVMNFLHGRVGYVLTGFVLTNVIVGFSMIGLLPLITGQINSSYITHLTEQILLLICLPMVAACITRYFYPEARHWGARMKNFSFALWCSTLFVIAAKAAEFFVSTPRLSWMDCFLIFAVTGLICALNFTFGKLITGPKFCRESSQILGQKNTTLTIFLAISFGGPYGAFVALGPTFYVFWHNAWNAVQMYLYDRRKIRKYLMHHPEK